MGAGEFGGQFLQPVGAAGDQHEIGASGGELARELIAARLAGRPADEDPWSARRAAFQVLDEIETSAESSFEVMTLLFGNGSLRAGHAEKQAHWQDLFTPLIEPRLPASDRRALQARAITASAITCMQAASQEWARLRGQGDLFDLYDTAVHAVRGLT